MAKLIFNYSVMNSGKTLDLLKTANNYEEEGYVVQIIKPAIDTRDKEVKSRVGISKPCVLIKKEDNIVNLLNDKIQILFVDEAQFLSKKQVDQLVYIADEFNIPVYAYGLRLTFKGEFFKGSKRLFEVADKLQEVKNVCHYCSKKATHNLLFQNGKIIDKLNDNVAIESKNNRYVACCRKHYNRIIQKS